MMQRISAVAIITALFVTACGTTQSSNSGTAGQPAVFTAADLAVFSPLPAQMEVQGKPVTAAKIALGRALFYETLLSEGHDVSCNSCHALNAYGADGRRELRSASTGVGRAQRPDRVQCRRPDCPVLGWARG